MADNVKDVDPLTCAWDTIYNELQWAFEYGNPFPACSSLRCRKQSSACHLTAYSYGGPGTTIHSRVVTYLLDHLKEVAHRLRDCERDELVLKTCDHWDNYRKGINRVRELLNLLDDLPMDALSRAGHRQGHSSSGDRWAYCTLGKGPLYHTCMKLCVDWVMGERFVFTVLEMMEQEEMAIPGLLSRATGVLDQLVPYNLRPVLKSYTKTLCRMESRSKLRALGVVRYMRHVKTRVASEADRMNRWYEGFEMETAQLVKHEMLTAHRSEIERKLKPKILVLMKRGSSLELKRICSVLYDLDWGIQLLSGSIMAHLDQYLKQTAQQLKNCKGEKLVTETCIFWDNYKRTIEGIRDFLIYLDDVPMHKYWRLCEKGASESMHYACIKMCVDCIMGKRFVFSVLSLIDKGKPTLCGLLKEAIRVLDEVVDYDILPELRNYIRKACSKEAQQELSRLSAVQYAKLVKWREAKELHRMKRWYPMHAKETVGIVRYFMLTLHRNHIKENWPPVMVQLIDAGQYQDLRHLHSALVGLDWGLQCVFDTFRSHLDNDLGKCEKSIISAKRGDPWCRLQAVWDRYANLIVRAFGDDYDLWRSLFKAFQSSMPRLIRRKEINEVDANNFVQRLLRVYPFLHDDPWGQNLPYDLILQIKTIVQKVDARTYLELSLVNSHWHGKPHIEKGTRTRSCKSQSQDCTSQLQSAAKLTKAKKTGPKHPEVLKEGSEASCMHLRVTNGKGCKQTRSGFRCLRNRTESSVQQSPAGRIVVNGPILKRTQKPNGTSSHGQDSRIPWHF